MVIFARKGCTSRMFEAVSVSHGFPLAGERMFWECACAEDASRNPVLWCKLQTGAAAKKNRLKK